MLKFDVDAWIQRCKTCKHSTTSRAFGVVCKLKGSCEFVLDLNKDKVIDQPEQFKKCIKCFVVKPIEDMHIRYNKGKRSYNVCKECFNRHRNELRREKRNAIKRNNDNQSKEEADAS